MEVMKFQSNEKVEVVVHKWFQMSVPNVYPNRIFKLLANWNIYNYVTGNYYVLQIRILPWWQYCSTTTISVFVIQSI